MKIHPTLYITPLFVPQRRFTDLTGKPCAFLETNPSLHINQETGDTTILVRCVDYRKFADKSFTLYQRQSNSIYYVGRMKLKQYDYLTTDNIEFQPVSVNYGLPKYPTYWTGPEDIRFLESGNKIIATIPECNERGQPAIFMADLKDSMISNCIPLDPYTCPEKNWMPFNGNKVIYKLHPLTIKDLEHDNKKIVGEYPILDGYHGSTNGIPFKGEVLFLIHSNRDKTYHRWIIMNPETYSLRISEEFVFFRNSYIEFTCSLGIFGSRIFISCGINDDKAVILEVSQLDILSFF